MAAKATRLEIHRRPAGEKDMYACLHKPSPISVLTFQTTNCAVVDPQIGYASSKQMCGIIMDI